MSSIVQPQSPRTPMKSLGVRENIPLPPTQPKLIQLGIKAYLHQKRERENSNSTPNPRVKKIKTATGETISLNSPGLKSVICHQCRQHVHAPLSVQCTKIKKLGKLSDGKRCTITYCNRCLLNRYDEKMNTILGLGELSEGHAHDAGYSWSCPSCRGTCNCSVCRKKKGLDPLGYTLDENLTNSGLHEFRSPRIVLNLRIKLSNKKRSLPTKIGSLRSFRKPMSRVLLQKQPKSRKNFNPLKLLLSLNPNRGQLTLETPKNQPLKLLIRRNSIRFVQPPQTLASSIVLNCMNLY